MKVVLAGASGLVGSQVLQKLMSRTDVLSVTTITRQPIAISSDKHVSIVAPLDAWPDHVAAAGPDIGICCLGTTIRAAGSREAFAAVDLDAVTAFARACHVGGARQFIMVTSVGADAAARNFYLSTKGKAEAAVQQVGFARLDIMRPGLLVGQRTGPTRIGERVAIAISPITDLLTPNVLSRYRSIPAQIVARSICAIAGTPEAGVFKHYNDAMRPIRSELDQELP